MSQLFRFIHFPADSATNYGFGEQKLSSLRAKSIETVGLPDRKINLTDEIWLLHSSILTELEVGTLSGPEWESISKVLVFESKQKIDPKFRVEFEFIISSEDLMSNAVSNPYWLLNQLYISFDLHRLFVKSLEDFVRNNSNSEDFEPGSAIQRIFNQLDIPIQDYSIFEGEMAPEQQIKNGVIGLYDSLFGIQQKAYISENSYNKITRQIVGLAFEKAFDIYEKRNLNKRLSEVKEKFDRSQKALIQSEKLSVAGKMTAAIAHEIKNPLQGVRNCFHLVSNQNLDQESKDKYLEMTNQELDRLTNTVQRMLEFYRPNEEFKTIQVLDVLEHTLNLLQGQLSEYGISVKTSWPLKVPPIQGIADQIEQVFMNLILNSRDFMQNGGTLLINFEVQKPYIAIIFEDSGPGVLPELREKIFEPFVSSKGTAGLGLSVCQEIITNHQGVIELMDELEGRGARFKIILPIKQ